jgi:hypothetical protein
LYSKCTDCRIKSCIVKRNLNSDGQQFYSHLTEHKKERTTNYDVGNSGPGLGQARRKMWRG